MASVKLAPLVIEPKGEWGQALTVDVITQIVPGEKHSAGNPGIWGG
jgi:hypothetical protein